MTLPHLPTWQRLQTLSHVVECPCGAKGSTTTAPAMEPGHPEAMGSGHSHTIHG